MLTIGHRGASAYKPENTLSSFQKAIELGADMIELDVHRCKTGEIVVIHDFTLGRTTSGKGLVKTKTLEQLKSLNIKKEEKIPTLQEVLDLVHHCIKINIELKGKKTAQPVLALIDEYVLHRGWDYNDFLISSFDYTQLQEIRKLNTTLKIGVLWARFPLRWLQKALAVHAYSVHSLYSKTTLKLVEKAHQHNLKVFVWTVNQKKDIEKMKTMGVDGIISNHPDLI